VGVRGGSPQWVVAYEVATPILPNLLVAVDPVMEVRRRAASLYASQLEFRAYDRAMEAFGALRALTLCDVDQAEAFFVLPAEMSQDVGEPLGGADGFTARREVDCRRVRAPETPVSHAGATG